MKANVSRVYGNAGVFSMEEVRKPVPKDNEVLVRVYVTTVTGSDIMMRKGNLILDVCI